MFEVHSALSLELDSFREALRLNFLAFARLDQTVNRIRWESASGNITERIYQMTQRPGSGISGQVIRYGRPFILDASHPDLEGERNRYPIMLVEQLRSVMAVPIMKNGSVVGVLLTGSRSVKRYEDTEIMELNRLGASIAELV
jgi:nitrogen regulatory protein A